MGRHHPAVRLRQRQQHFPGLNWPDGSAVLEAGCAVHETIEPPPEETTTTTVAPTTTTKPATTTTKPSTTTPPPPLFTANAFCGPDHLPLIAVTFGNRPDLDGNFGILDFSDRTSYGPFLFVSGRTVDLVYPQTTRHPTYLHVPARADVPHPRPDRNGHRDPPVRLRAWHTIAHTTTTSTTEAPTTTTKPETTTTKPATTTTPGQTTTTGLAAGSGSTTTVAGVTSTTTGTTASTSTTTTSIPPPTGTPPPTAAPTPLDPPPVEALAPGEVLSDPPPQVVVFVVVPGNKRLSSGCSARSKCALFSANSLSGSWPTPATTPVCS